VGSRGGKRLGCGLNEQNKRRYTRRDRGSLAKRIYEQKRVKKKDRKKKIGPGELAWKKKGMIGGFGEEDEGGVRLEGKSSRGIEGN